MSLSVTGRSTSSERTRAVWLYASCRSDSAVEFGERHDLHAWALPFRGHTIDSIELIGQLGELLAGRRGGCQRVPTNFLRSRIDVGTDFRENSLLLENAMLVHGWWRGGETTSGLYFCNPDYYHRHPESDIATARDERRERLRQTAELGILNPSEIAPMFGFQSSGMSAANTVSKTAYRLGFAWSDCREEGWRTMGRTWKTLNRQWDYTQVEIARAFNTTQSVVSRKIQRVPDFDPPADPTADVVETMTADSRSAGGDH